MRVYTSILFASFYLGGLSQDWPTSGKFNETPTGLRYLLLSNIRSANVDTNTKYIYFKYIWFSSADKKIKLSTVNDPPLEFYIKSNKFVSGFNEALKMLNAGEKAYFIIPKSLAYGENGIEGEIDLYYYIEVVDRK